MRIAVLGTGVLGSAIAERFSANGHDVTVYNRTVAKTALLQARGLTAVAEPEQAIRTAEVTLLTLSDFHAIQSVLLTADSAGALCGKTVIQMGTIGPEESMSLSNRLDQLGSEYVEAPVLGSVPETMAGSLLVMVGSTAEQFRRWRPMLQILGRDVHHIGPIGKAAVMKLALNQLIAAETAAFALSLGLVRRASISADTFITLLRKSALYAPTFDKKLPRLLERQYDSPNFSARHLLKDVNLILRIAEQSGLATTGLEGVRSLLQGALARGLTDSDYSCLYEVIDRVE